MQAQRATSQQASQWFVRGWQIFKVQPFLLIALTMLYIASLGVIGLIPVVGALLGFLLTPTLTFGFMEVSRVLSLPPGQRPARILPTILLTGLLRSAHMRRHFLLLGAGYVGGVLLALLASSWADGGTLIKAFLLGAPLTEQQLTSGELLPPLLVVMLVYLPFLLAFWYAPALVGWANLTPGKAIFFSLVASWRNKVAFSVYSLVALGYLILVQIGAGALVSILGPTLGGFVAAPFTLALLATWLCSYYPTYVDVFGAVPPVTLITEFPS